MATKTIKVEYISRVEGEGALDLEIAGGKVTSAQLRIFEPPRFFEAFLRGRGHEEIPDIVARICGICPVAYQMGAVHAIEDAFGVKVEGQLRALRRLLYCGEWIESHGLHVVMLHAPDFLGYPDAIQMAAQHGDVVRRGLALKKAGNEILRVLGGREIHPVSVKPGGFHRVPTKAELAPLAEELKRARDIAVDLVRWVAKFPFPDLEQDYEFVAMRHKDEYPLNEGRLVSNRGIDLDIADYETTFEERHVARSTALHSLIKGRGAYLVGPMARYALNFDRLPASIQGLAAEAGLGPVERNPFKSIIVRSLEIAYASEEALRIIADYERPEPAVLLEPRAGVGYGCTEAPRGICWHRYEFEEDGTVKTAKIVPPTSQNQPSIEADLMSVATSMIDASDDEIRHRCEQTIRNYDPCISCSAHFLKLTVTRL
ncbi:MAG: Ni/Fe hydrogenase subunit alpha [Devosia nanyangense]|uniref:Ni/Fe hydrogenase subunit alpha n=1 Tax=Devosia nanyangense TaxID=1228055 RepID=A0A933NWY3_9HYPH|nr:Ni/Fe hydrogenase subunit alpha [Devosia nanyangense]